MIRRRLQWSMAVALVASGAAAVARVEAATPPAAPSSLTATTTGGNLVLAWVDNAVDETGFSVERCLGSGCTGFGQIGTVGADVTTFTDAFKATGTNRYRVRAVNASGGSEPSNVVDVVLLGTGEVFAVISATPIAGQAPLTVTFDGTGSSALGGPITSYTWSFGDNATTTGAVVAHTYAQPGVYAASLTARGGQFNGGDTTAVIITVSAPPLVAPSNLTAASAGRARVSLSWTNQPTSATALTVERCRGAGCTSFTPVAAVPLDATGYVDADVKRNTTYTYRLAASGVSGVAYSNTAVVAVRK